MSSQRLTQTQKMLQKLSPQQILLMKLLQIPTMELSSRIKEEIEENPALEENEEFSNIDDDSDNDSDMKFYCVGSSVVRYYMNDYSISNLESHKAKKIGVDMIATFLPDDVVDGLYKAVESAGLSVASLTSSII